MDNEELKNLLQNCNQKIEFVKTLVTNLSGLNCNEDKIREYCEKNAMEFNEVIFNQQSFQITINELMSTCQDLESIIEFLSSFFNANMFLINNISCWQHYNEQYKTYYLSKIKNFDEKIYFSLSKNILNCANYFNNIKNVLTVLKNDINLSIDELFENFKYGDKNYVIFGKNGAGKTTLLNKIALSIFKENSIVIPASRSLHLHSSTDSYFTHPSQSLNDIVKDNNALQYMSIKISGIALKELQKDKMCYDSLQKFKDIFNKLDLQRKVEIEDNYIYLYVDDVTKKYELTNGSDGEKAVIFLILSVLLLPENAFVFIDEPELHLNGALMQKLFNILESERKDVKFIYVTHIINFVESRKNVELIYLDKTSKHNLWSFKHINDFESTDIDMILGIEGTLDDIVFCEGDSASSIDYKILSCVYDDCFIKPVGSCEVVLNNTKLLQTTGKYSFLKRKACAVIDNDFKTEEEIKNLNCNNITILTYNEWENLLLSEDVLNYINENTCNKKLENVKQHVINNIRTSKVATMNDFLNKKYLKIMQYNKLSYNNLEENLKIINSDNLKKIQEELYSYETLFDKYLQENNYEELIKIVPGKKLIKDAVKQLGFSTLDDFLNRLINLIQTDASFKAMIKAKINLIRN